MHQAFGAFSISCSLCFVPNCILAALLLLRYFTFLSVMLSGDHTLVAVGVVSCNVRLFNKACAEATVSACAILCLDVLVLVRPDAL